MGTAGLIEDESGLRAFFEDEQTARAVATRYGSDAIEVRAEKPPWTLEFSREDWDAICIGERFFVVPPWVDTPTPEGRYRLSIDAATAFGTGRHESTQLVMEALEGYIKGGETVVDVGCGTGILGLAAQALGAAEIVSCDIHADTLGSVRQRLRSVFLGSADAIRDSAADVTVVNISARVVDALASEVRRMTKPTGVVIVAGFIRENTPKRFRPDRILERGDWLCWVCKQESVDAAAMNRRPLQPYSEQWW